MKLIELIRKEPMKLRKDILLAITMAGIANTAILAVINSTAHTATPADVEFQNLLLFAIAITLYLVCLKATFEKSPVLFEGLVKNIRQEITSKIRHADLIVFEQIGKAQIYNQLTTETAVISESAGRVVSGFQSIIIVLCIAIYISFLSVIAFVLTIILSIGFIGIYLYSRKETEKYIQLSTDKEVEFVNSVTHLIEGFKEVKSHQLRSEDLSEDIGHISEAVKDLKIKTETIFTRDYVFSQCFYYILVASFVFLLPRIVSTYSDIITEIITVILFILGPLASIVLAIPAWTKSNIAAKNILRLGEQLDAYQVPREDVPAHHFGSFSEITLQDIEFAYRETEDGHVFSIGPLSLTVKAREILFIIGGNGSGKTTLLKLITALYYPDRGTITVDHTPIHRHMTQNYRELFSSIFADFHLFEKLYGLRNISNETVQDLLRLLGLESKTTLLNGTFSNLDLSTGQRKRLALLVTLLEDRPIYVFDEWSAGQDANFRRYFFEVLLPELKQRDKTVIVVTHDDTYFGAADRLLKMEAGKLEPMAAS